MDRVKLIDRLRKLLAMSRDTSSPEEAEIADRRMKALMNKYDVSFREIAGTERDYAPRPPKTRSSTRRKRKQATVKRTRSVSPMFIGLFAIAATGSLWLLLTRTSETEFGTTSMLPQQAETSATHSPASLQTSVNRSSIIEGESIVLNITGSGLSSVPSTSGLLQSFRIINSKINRTPDKKSFQMLVQLQPLKTGTLLIPSFSIDGIRSESIIIDVVARQ